MNSFKKKFWLNKTGSSLVELIIVTILFAIFIPISLNIFIGGRKVTGQSYIQHAAATTLTETTDILEFIRNEDYDLLTEGAFYLIRNPGNNSWLIKSDLPDKDTFERFITVSNAWRYQDTDDLYFGDEPGFTGTFYLHDDETFDREDPEDLLDSVAPTNITLTDYDEDDKPGLLIQKGYEPQFPDNVKYQDWILTPPLTVDAVINGNITLDIWTAMKDFKTDKTGVIVAELFDDNDSQTIAIKTVTKSNWTEDSFVQVPFDMGNVNYTIPTGNRLILRIYVDGSSDDDMWFAYDTTSYSSVGVISNSLGINLYEDPNTKKVAIEILWAPDYIPLDLISRTFYVSDWQDNFTYPSS